MTPSPLERWRLRASLEAEAEQDLDPESGGARIDMFRVGDHIFTFVKQLVLVQIIKRCLVEN
jgi:hypothetical protein